METSQRAKCSRNHPPSGFHGDGAGRWSSGSPAAADVACAGLAWGGRRGGAAPGSRALGRGRPRAECNNEPRTVGPPPPGGFLDSSGRRWVLLADFLLPIQHHQAWGQASLRAPHSLSEVPGPVSGGKIPLPVTALAL